VVVLPSCVVLAVISYPPIPLFEVGPLTMSLHGVFAALGFVLGAIYTTRVLQRAVSRARLSSRS
jgi:prolipoprotein diacylglyceryltransferase